MTDQRTHYVTTSDRVTIGATVHGQGPPLVLLQGSIGDGDMDWGRVAQHLNGRFTCHLPSLRGRARSGEHADLNPRRLVEDVLAYVDSLGEPAVLVGWSLGAELALAAAAAAPPGAVRGVVPFEPVVVSVTDEQALAALGEAVGRATALAGEGRFAAAARAFAGWPFNEAEVATADELGYFEAAGRYVPDLLQLLHWLMEYDAAVVDDPAVLGAFSTPVVMLQGTTTKPFFTAGARHVADLVPGARVHEIVGAGHAAPLTHPEALAEALLELLTPILQPA